MDRFLLQPGDADFLAGYRQTLDGAPPPTATFDPSLCLPLIGFRQTLGTPVGAPSAVFTVTKAVTPFSVKFYEFCLRAKPLGVGAQQPTYLHLLRDEEGAATLLFSIALRDARVSAVELQGQPDGSTMEQLTLSADEVTWTYTFPQDAGPQFRAGFSLTQDKPIITFT